DVFAHPRASWIDPPETAHAVSQNGTCRIGLTAVPEGLFPATRAIQPVGGRALCRPWITAIRCGHGLSGL
ncbi:MAG TPA: hypothetical protein VLW53_23680, partial [Candidatus Eisenbacteria bacterium]|nr:hypothetical protein [Candidatus Eisenbacteria bacterium]